MLIDDLEDDPVLQDAILSVHHATFHTFAGPAVKIVENQLGRAFVKVNQPVAVPMQIAMPPGVVPQVPGMLPGPPAQGP